MEVNSLGKKIFTRRAQNKPHGPILHVTPTALVGREAGRRIPATLLCSAWGLNSQKTNVGTDFHIRLLPLSQTASFKKCNSAEVIAFARLIPELLGTLKTNPDKVSN